MVLGSLAKEISLEGNWSSRYNFFLELVPDDQNLGDDVVHDADVDVGDNAGKLEDWPLVIVLYLERERSSSVDS